MSLTMFQSARAAFAGHATLSAVARRRALAALARAVHAHADRLCAAVDADFGHRSAQEVRLTEIVPVLGEIAHQSAHLGRWMKPRRVWPNCWGTSRRVTWCWSRASSTTRWPSSRCTGRRSATPC